MAKTTIEQIDVKGKRVLMRVDFNVPLEDGKVADDMRIEAALPSIQSVLDRGGSVVLMSHLGRPKGQGYESSSSLEPVASCLGKLLGVDVQFPSRDCIDDTALGATESLKPGGVVLLENLRFHKGEKEGDPAFGEKLSAHGDAYCNDAFGACHRADASMVAVPRIMKSQRKPAVCGLLVEREIRYLSEALASPAKPYVAVIGGAKVSDKLGVIERLVRETDAVLIGGAMAYTFLRAMGRKVGSSRVEEDRLADAKRILDLAAVEPCDLYLPEDHVAADSFTESPNDIEVFTGDIADGFMGLDIGPKTQAKYASLIEKAKTVVWNGPMGVFEWRPFRVGTSMVAQAMAEATAAGATTIVGGGDSAAAAAKFDVAERVSHVSTGGGASLAMLEGRPFEAVEALDG